MADEKLEQVTTGATVRKRSLGIIEEKPSTVGSHLRDDVLVPGIKKILNDIIKSASDWFFFGVKGAPVDRHRPLGGNVQYSNYYDRPVASAARPSTTFSPEDVVMSTRGDAETVLVRMQEYLGRYGTVPASKLYDLNGIRCPYTAENYGWRNLDNARVREVRGGYIIDFPKMEALN